MPKEVIKQSRTSQMTQRYKVKEKLGRGAFAIVRRAVRKSDNVQFALKVVRKKGMDEYNLKALEQEVNIMNNLDHPNIVRLHDLYDTPNHLHMIIDLLSGGELFERILDKGHFSEKDAAHIITQVAEALNYLHSKKIVHRDLKPENLLFANTEDDTIKLVDFGLAKKNVTPLTTPCGSPAYVAPEVLERQAYGCEVDWWSLGVILYILLCGFPPFHDEMNNLKRLYRKIRKGLTGNSFPSPYWDKISDEAKDLVKKLLTVDPKKRGNGETIMNHPWTKTNSTATIVTDQLKHHSLRQRMKRGVNTILAVLRMVEVLGENQVAAVLENRRSEIATVEGVDEEEKDVAPQE